MKQNTTKNKPKKKYRITNWPAYNQALKERGSLEMWIDTETKEGWYAEAHPVQGAQPVYSDLAIQAMLLVKKVFHLPLRGLQGFMMSFAKTAGLSLRIPDYTTVSRRAKDLPVILEKKRKEKTILVIDSTGAKLYGEGEWKVRQHGVSKRRTWKKIHVAIDEKGEIRATEITGNDTHDSEVVEALLHEEEALIQALAADGAYDKRKVYAACEKLGIADIRIPPQKNAKIWRHGNRKEQPHPRDVNLRRIREIGRKAWKQEIAYHLRSLVENTMFRWKTIFGEKLSFRSDPNQHTESKICALALNRMCHLGMPIAEVVA